MTYTEALKGVGKSIVSEARYNLQRLRKIKTGTLYRSVKSDVVNDEIEIYTVDYGRWVDQGRRRRTRKDRTKGLTKYVKPTYFLTDALKVTNDMNKAIDYWIETELNSMDF